MFTDTNGVHPVVITFDCQAVVDGTQRTYEARIKYNRPLASFWAQVGQFHLRAIKGKSYLSVEQAKRRGEGQWNRGNDVADQFATRARPQFDKDQLKEFIAHVETDRNEAARWAKIV